MRCVGTHVIDDFHHQPSLMTVVGTNVSGSALRMLREKDLMQKKTIGLIFVAKQNVVVLCSSYI